MITESTPIRFKDQLPESVDVVVIGGGIIGVCSALYLSREGKRVVLLEKGRIAGEQSSRNWGWVRQHGRDADELPIMIEANRMWAEIDKQTKGRTGFKRGGVLYLASSQKELERRAKWLEVAKDHQLGSRLLERKEINRLIDFNTSGKGHEWVGATYTENDARAEPWQAVPAIADLAHSEGVEIRENCAVRTLENSAGKITGVVTEMGSIKAEQVVLAGGSWSSLFLRRHGILIPQLSVRVTVGQSAPMPEIFAGNAADEKLAFRRREDGGYTLSASDSHDLYLGPDSFRTAFTWLPVAAQSLGETKFRPFSPMGFPDGWGISRKWAGDEQTPFERMRVLDPAPSHSHIARIQKRFEKRFPLLGKPEILKLWGGMIDAMPDVVPIVDKAPSLDGLIIATGMSGHGFGIGPAFGKIVAKIACGKPTGHNMERFRFSRFNDGSKMRPGPAI